VFLVWFVDFQNADKNMNKNEIEEVLIEIRSGEGGDDAKLLVKDQAKMYVKYAQLECL